MPFSSLIVLAQSLPSWGTCSQAHSIENLLAGRLDPSSLQDHCARPLQQSETAGGAASPALPTIGFPQYPKANMDHDNVGNQRSVVASPVSLGRPPASDNAPDLPPPAGDTLRYPQHRSANHGARAGALSGWPWSPSRVEPAQPHEATKGHERVSLTHPQTPVVSAFDIAPWVRSRARWGVLPKGLRKP